jgi:hypothetical protein
MTEHDSLSEVLHEWKPAEPSQEFDQRVLVAYRKAEGSLWNRVWQTRVSVPVPVLVLAALLLFALVFWFRPSTGGGVGNQLDAAGFQPLPHGDAHVISVKELYK